MNRGRNFFQAWLLWFAVVLRGVHVLTPRADADGGTPLWTNRYGGAAHAGGSARAVAVDGSGNVFVTGSSANGYYSDYATVAYSAAGAPLWTNRYNGPGQETDVAVGVAVDGSGNVFVAG